MAGGSADGRWCLSGEQVALIGQGAGICAVSRDVRLIPSLSHVLGCRVSAGRDLLTLYVNHGEARDFLRDAESSRRVAAVFSIPSTHQTIQIKGQLVSVQPVRDDDLAVIRRSIDAFTRDVATLGFSADYAHCVNAYIPGELVAVTYRPTHIYDQTPGVGAGNLVSSAPC